MKLRSTRQPANRVMASCLDPWERTRICQGKEKNQADGLMSSSQVIWRSDGRGRCPARPALHQACSVPTTTRTSCHLQDIGTETNSDPFVRGGALRRIPVSAILSAPSL